jgi:hypothetical protein
MGKQYHYTIRVFREPLTKTHIIDIVFSNKTDKNE